MWRQQFFFKINALSNLPALAIATCSAQQLPAADFVVSGEQAVQVVQNSVTSTVQTATFIVTRVGSNWSIINDYTNSGAREYIALVDGRSYSATWDIAGTTSSGLVVDPPADRLDASTEFTRLLIPAFLLSGEPGASLTNPPVGFLFPRHPGLHCYRWEMERSTESPFLPKRIRFRLDKELVQRVPRDAVTYFFRSGYRDQTLFRRFQATQRNGAEYSVTAWTNWGGLNIPLKATLSHTYFDHMDARSSFRRLLSFSVTGVGRPPSNSLVPPLLPGSSVQEVINGTCYLYTTAGGNYLSPEQTMSVGRVLMPAAPPPRWVTAVGWVSWFPWRTLLCFVAIFGVVLAVGILGWFGFRFLNSRE